MTYCPKINEELVKRLYKLKQSQKKKKPITQMVNEAVELYLEKHETGPEPEKLADNNKEE